MLKGLLVGSLLVGSMGIPQQKALDKVEQYAMKEAFVEIRVHHKFYEVTDIFVKDLVRIDGQIDNIIANEYLTDKQKIERITTISNVKKIRVMEYKKIVNNYYRIYNSIN